MKKAFLEKEGNAYFERNKNHNTNNDIIIDNLNINNISNNTILEIGCSDGWRLNKLYELNKNNNYNGFDPSIDAINNGTYNIPSLGAASPSASSVNNATINAEFNISGGDPKAIAEEVMHKLNTAMKKKGSVNRF